MATGILLVEAPKLDGPTYARVLETAGFDVTAVVDARAAFDVVNGLRPRVIIVCIEAGKLDGHVNVCVQLQQVTSRDRALAAPIMLIASHLEPLDVPLAAKAGVHVLTATPAEGAKLVAAIRGVIAAGPERTPA